MALRIWFEEDIRNVIAGLALTAHVLPNSDTAEGLAFREGFYAAMQVLSTSFGISSEMHPQSSVLSIQALTLDSGSSD